MSVAARIVSNVIALTAKAATQSSTGGTALVTSQQIADALRAIPTASGASVTDETAMQVSAVYSCVRLLSESVAMLPVWVYRRTENGDEVPAPDHYLNAILAVKPNRWQTAFDYWRMAMGHLLIRGNHYSQVVRSPKGLVIELIPLNPSNMEVKQRATGELYYTYRRGDGVPRVFAQTDIFHLRLLGDGLTGRSPIDSMSEAIGTARSAESHAGRLFGAGIQTTGVLKHPNSLSAEAVTRLADSFAARYAGSENAFRPLILEEGMEWQQIGMTSEQSQFLEARKFQRNEIAMFFGVPPHMIGDVERGTSWGSGIEQQGLGFLTHTLMPHLVNLEQAIDVHLLGDFNYFTKHDTSEIIRVDFRARQAGYETMRRNGVINANEWRKFEGLQPRPDPEGEEYTKANFAKSSTNATDNTDGQDSTTEPTEDQ